ncbi:tetratricopeptide repeat protein [Leptolyngbya ohadii]|uniref:tetratricopeptide repeat protein n=1 Tax=Leptolyngbya ohadii TaxID=1962290 RepID=UPI00117A44B6|nr:tetratricopeptide repeat protein [Leptolyngbya ohadii]
MKKRPFLDVLENASLVGLGVGSVASLVTQQAFYATGPLSLLVVLGLFNRRQFEKQIGQDNQNALASADRRLSQKIDRLTAQVEQMPSPETIHKLKRGVLLKNRQLAEHFYSEMASLQERLEQQLNSLEQKQLFGMQLELQSLSEQYQQLVEGMALLNADISQLQNRDDRSPELFEEMVKGVQHQVSELRSELDGLAYQAKANSSGLLERINRIDRHLSNLPPSTDTGVTQQELAELVKTIGDLVSKREFGAVAGDVQNLQRDQDALKQSLQAIEAAAISLRRSLQPLSAEAPPQERTIESELASLISQHRVSQNSSEAFLAPTNLYPEIQQLAAGYLKNLRSQLRTVHQFTEQLAQQQKNLQEQIHRLPKSLDMVALQQQLKELAHRIPSTESTYAAFESRVQAVLQQELQAINEQLQALPPTPQNELLFDFNEENAAASPVAVTDRALLEAALNHTQERLILIWSWSEQDTLDDELLQKLETFLSQKRRLDLGWCHLATADVESDPRSQERLLARIRRGWNNQPEQTALQETLKKLLQLKRAYPEYFQFKILGASESFLVSDRTFAVLGIADPLKTTAAFTELQLKLRTTEPEMIQRLIDRFDNPTIDPEDLTAYWNRAVTRYDLGDKAGATEDFQHILAFQPNDAAALNALGVALYDLGDREGALLDFSQSIQANPHQIAAYLNRGFIRSEQGDLWGAISDYTVAIQMAPERALAYFYRGLAWQKQEQHREAVTDFSHAIRLAPDTALVCYYRGLARHRLGQLQEAIEDLQKAVDYFTARGSKTNAAKAIKHLARLRREIEQRAQSAPMPLMDDTEPTLPLMDAIGFFPSRASDSENGHYQGSQPVVVVTAVPEGQDGDPID